MKQVKHYIPIFLTTLVVRSLLFFVDCVVVCTQRQIKNISISIILSTYTTCFLLSQSNRIALEVSSVVCNPLCCKQTKYTERRASHSRYVANLLLFISRVSFLFASSSYSKRYINFQPTTLFPLTKDRLFNESAQVTVRTHSASETNYELAGSSVVQVTS